MADSNEQFDVFSVDLNAETDRYFKPDSVPADGKPRLILIMGGPASGKTTLRREQYSTGFVLIDAAEIFNSLSRGGYYDFPDAFEEPMDLIGRLVASRAITERRNIVTEIIGSDFDVTTELIEAMRSVGYTIEVVSVTCDIEEAMKRNLARGEDNISSYFAEPFQRRWLIDATQVADDSN
jgi:dephospho-CoA kinase